MAKNIQGSGLERDRPGNRCPWDLELNLRVFTPQPGFPRTLERCGAQAPVPTLCSMDLGMGQRREQAPREVSLRRWLKKLLGQGGQ